MQASILEPNDIHKHLKVKPGMTESSNKGHTYLRSGRKPVHFKERIKSGGKSEAHRKGRMEDEEMVSRKREKPIFGGSKSLKEQCC